MQTHLATHTTKKKYECQICNKFFSDARSLGIHTNSHTGIDQLKTKKRFPCTCPFCDHSSKEKRDLERHTIMLIHTDRKREFEYEICKKTYMSTLALHTHTKQHEHKHIKCELCNKVGFLQINYAEVFVFSYSG